MPDEIPSSYMRYLENGIREVYELDGIPVAFNPRSTKNPYANKKPDHLRNNGRPQKSTR
jgi:GTPase